MRYFLPITFDLMIRSGNMPMALLPEYHPQKDGREINVIYYEWVGPDFPLIREGSVSFVELSISDPDSN
jgi:hypothetical protein